MPGLASRDAVLTHASGRLVRRALSTQQSSDQSGEEGLNFDE